MLEMFHSNPLVEYFRCPDSLVQLQNGVPLSPRAGYFMFRDAVCFGRLANQSPADHLDPDLVDVFAATKVEQTHVLLPFDLSEVVSNLRQEQYQQNGYNFLDRVTSGQAAQHLYYFVRPLLRVGVRKHLQKIRLSGWQRIAFPRWP